MALEYVDIVELETLERVLDRLKYMLLSIKMNAVLSYDGLLEHTLRLSPY
jgi:hypothetical protein